MIDVESSSFRHGEVQVNQLPNRLPMTPLITGMPVISNFNGWKYSMRRSMQEIVPGVFLGPYSSAMKAHLNTLVQHGITHIICVRQDIEAQFIRPHFMDRFCYLTLDIADSVTENIIPYFSKVRQFIEDCLAEGGKVLVHGNGGISRSAALVLSYVMQKYGLSCRDAYVYVKERRYCIKPNDGFLAQLTEFEPIYRAQQILEHGQSSSDHFRPKKRKMDQLETDCEMTHDSDCEMLPLPPPPSPVSEETDTLEMCVT